MEQIKIHDDFLNHDDLERCKQIIKDGKWEYGQQSNPIDKHSFSNPFFYMDLNNMDFFNSYLKEKIEQTLGQKIALDRVYANGQTFGLDGSFHKDNEDPTAITFCLYISPIPNGFIEEAGGNIFFKVPGIDHFSLALEPRYNRGVSFPSYYIHKGMTFNRYIKNMRISIAWKLRIKN